MPKKLTTSATCLILPATLMEEIFVEEILPEDIFAEFIFAILHKIKLLENK